MKYLKLKAKWKRNRLNKLVEKGQGLTYGYLLCPVALYSHFQKSHVFLYFSYHCHPQNLLKTLLMHLWVQVMDLREDHQKNVYVLRRLMVKWLLRSPNRKPVATATVVVMRLTYLFPRLNRNHPVTVSADH